MVIEQIVRRLDDLDGSELDQAEEPLTFALEGIQYRIDLSISNIEKLRAVLAPYIAVAQCESQDAELPQSRSERARTRRAIRDWASANGLAVSQRGRISDEVLAAYAVGALDAPRPVQRL